MKAQTGQVTRYDYVKVCLSERNRLHAFGSKYFAARIAQLDFAINAYEKETGQTASELFYAQV